MNCGENSPLISSHCAALAIYILDKTLKQISAMTACGDRYIHIPLRGNLGIGKRRLYQISEQSDLTCCPCCNTHLMRRKRK